MNKKILIPLIILILLGSGYFLVNSTGKKDNPTETNTDTTNTTSVILEDEIEVLEDTLGVFESENLPASANKYVITKGSTVGYVVQKRFLEKKDAEVVGTTDSLVGAGWFDEASKTLGLLAEIDLSTLKTDNSTRDLEIQPLFIKSIAKIEFDETGVEQFPVMNEEFEADATVNLTINDTTRAVTFRIIGMITNDSFYVRGSSEIKMSDFGIKAPSLLKVYTVDDETELVFEVSSSIFETEVLSEKGSDPTNNLIETEK